MKLPSITNATLTKVEGRSFTSDYDRDEVSGPTKWTGSEDVFWSESIQEVIGGDTKDIVVRRSLVIDAAVVIPWAVNDKVTAVRDGATVTGVVQRAFATKGDNIGGVVRVVLEDA